MGSHFSGQRVDARGWRPKEEGFNGGFMVDLTVFRNQVPNTSISVLQNEGNLRWHAFCRVRGR